ncbi:hypothetical protein A0H81_05292 [Grifola frondosa]|uniref:cellulose 1,4-beta-cellobiosidase (non-reducing end) n=1 Tax=Grifola frondosa TaxID=5627 RepID=A0A1C7MF26_GRIFR|nr:hypothetical protein A0H81_05292 [Grifola frondosa]
MSEMDADGGLPEFPNNTVCATYGAGYCDSQCPQDIKFINGEVRRAACIHRQARSDTRIRLTKDLGMKWRDHINTISHGHV